MNIKDIEIIFHLVMDGKTEEKERIEFLKTSYNIDDIYKECLEAEMYPDMAIQFYLNTIKEKLDGWAERGLLEINKKTK